MSAGRASRSVSAWASAVSGLEASGLAAWASAVSELKASGLAAWASAVSGLEASGLAAWVSEVSELKASGLAVWASEVSGLEASGFQGWASPQAPSPRERTRPEAPRPVHARPEGSGESGIPFASAQLWAFDRRKGKPFCRGTRDRSYRQPSTD